MTCHTMITHARSFEPLEALPLSRQLPDLVPSSSSKVHPHSTSKPKSSTVWLAVALSFQTPPPPRRPCFAMTSPPSDLSKGLSPSNCRNMLGTQKRGHKPKLIPPLTTASLYFLAERRRPARAKPMRPLPSTRYELGSGTGMIWRFRFPVVVPGLERTICTPTVRE